jgi:hypothetical protein
MQTTSFSKNINEINKLKQWWTDLVLSEKSKLLQVDAGIVVQQLQSSKNKKTDTCHCDICKGSVAPTNKMIASKLKKKLNSSLAIENYLNEAVKEKIDFSSKLNIDKNKISICEEFLKEDKTQIIDIVKKISGIFIDDYNVPVQELPSPNDTRVMFYKKCVNIQHLFRCQSEFPNEKKSGKLLFQIYLARLFSHNIISAYKSKIALDNQRNLIKSEESKKKKKVKKESKESPRKSSSLQPFDDLSVGSFEYSPERKKCQSPPSPVGWEKEMKKNQLNFFDSSPFTLPSFNLMLNVQ